MKQTLAEAEKTINECTRLLGEAQKSLHDMNIRIHEILLKQMNERSSAKSGGSEGGP